MHPAKLKKNYCNVYLFILRRARMSWGGAEREGERESEAGSMLSVQSPIGGGWRGGWWLNLKPMRS